MHAPSSPIKLDHFLHKYNGYTIFWRLFSKSCNIYTPLAIKDIFLFRLAHSVTPVVHHVDGTTIPTRHTPINVG